MEELKNERAKSIEVVQIVLDEGASDDVMGFISSKIPLDDLGAVLSRNKL